MAEKYRYIMIAPDSQTAAMTGWRVPLANQPPTPDVLHAQVRCASAFKGSFGGVFRGSNNFSLYGTTSVHSNLSRTRTCSNAPFSNGSPLQHKGISVVPCSKSMSTQAPARIILKSEVSSTICPGVSKAT